MITLFNFYLSVLSLERAMILGQFEYSEKRAEM